MKSGHNLSINIISAYAIWNNKKLLSLLSPPVLITKSMLSTGTDDNFEKISSLIWSEEIFPSATYSESSGVQSKLAEANNQIQSSPLQFLVDTVPDNAFKAMSNNSLMLQVIFFTIFLGISMLLIGEEKSKPLKSFFDSLNYVVLKMVDLIMKTAPLSLSIQKIQPLLALMWAQLY